MVLLVKKIDKKVGSADPKSL